MKTLYMFTKSPWARRDMEDWLPRLDAADAILLIQDAVLAMKGAPPKVAEALRDHEGRLFVLQADIVARGVPAGAAQVVDDAGTIRLLGEYHRVVAL